MLKLPRAAQARADLGGVGPYILNYLHNRVVGTQVNIEALGRELGVLHEWRRCSNERADAFRPTCVRKRDGRCGDIGWWPRSQMRIAYRDQWLILVFSPLVLPIVTWPLSRSAKDRRRT